MSKGKNKLGNNKRGSYKQSSNPARVAAMQNLLRSGAYGAHRGEQDRPRNVQDQDAIEEQLDDWDEE